MNNGIPKSAAPPYGGLGNGINLEWTRDVVLEDPTCFGNMNGGIGGFGDVTGLRIVNPNLHGNNGAGYLGEVSFLHGAWWDGSVQGLARDFTVEGGSITPSAGGAHLCLDVPTAMRKGVTYPAKGAPARPQVRFGGVAGLGAPAAVKLNYMTPRTDLDLVAA